MYEVVSEEILGAPTQGGNTGNTVNPRTTESSRNKDNKQWYKDFIARCGGNISSGVLYNSGTTQSYMYGVNDFRRMVVNYDLFNNLLHKEDFTYVFQPYGTDVGELPADFTNKDIISSKIKVLLSMERSRPFDWHVMATNPEATTRREEERDKLLTQYVVQQIMQPIQQQVMAKYQRQLQEIQQAMQQLQQEAQAIEQQQQQYDEEKAQYDQQQAQEQQRQAEEEEEQSNEPPSITDIFASSLSAYDEAEEEPQRQPFDKIRPQQPPMAEAQQQQLQEAMEQLQQQAQQLQQQMQEEIKSMTPQEVDKYMQRQYQDPAEFLCQQLLHYIMNKESVKEKFNEGFKHGLIAGRTIFWTGILNKEPVLRVVNPLGFSYDTKSMLSRIEDSEWAAYEQYMSPTDIISAFGDDLTDSDIDKIYNAYNFYNGSNLFNSVYNNYQGSGVRVVHCEWKALKKIKFVKGVDIETQQPYEFIADEHYQLNKMAGDIEADILWIPTRFEGYKIANDIYVYLREVPGQYKNLDNLYECKLSYIGNAYDNTNSLATSLVDRMKYYQYLYNIIWYRIELLTAKDDGKKMLIDASVINSSSKLDVNKWFHFLKANNVAIVNSSEEGNKGMPTNIGGLVSQIDMSMSSDIQRYIQLAQYIEQVCSANIGFTQQYLQNIEQVEVRTDKPYHSNLLDSYFHVHRDIKCRVLQSLVECMKVAYATYQPEKLSYILDDVSVQMLQPDYDLLENSIYGIFITDNPKIDSMLDTIKALSQAALQNQRVELSDVIKILTTDDLEEAQELLAVAEQRLRERQQEQAQQEQAMQQQQLQVQQEMQEKEQQFKMAFMERQEQLRTEREVRKQAIFAMGFNEDKDIDNDGQLDVLEIYKEGKKAEINEKKLQLNRDKLRLQEKAQKDKVAMQKAQLKIQQKAAQHNLRMS